MVYNTRRKSLSLSELGIIVPKRARAPSQPSPPATINEGEEPPAKKSKVTHLAGPPSPGAMSPPRTTNIHVKPEQTRSTPRPVEHTPPPSPGAAGVAKVDTEGIKDEIVVGVIHQLEKTGNRPHTSKELAAVLLGVVPTIDSSTNPNALIQARLAAYLKGPWPLVSPCPLGKQQESTHPRRVFYHLTTSPAQPIPEASHHVPIARRIISPSLSSASNEQEEKYVRTRTQLSPSPEVDLSSPELDDTDVEVGSTFSSRASLARDHPQSNSNLAHNRRADSPPLEREERDFKQTANELQQQRRSSQQQVDSTVAETVPSVESLDDVASVEMSAEPVEETEESVAMRTKEAVATLFGDEHHLSVAATTSYDLSSPVIKPQTPVIDIKMIPKSVSKDMDTLSLDNTKAVDPMDVWGPWDESGDFLSPENIELDELEGLFDAY